MRIVVFGAGAVGGVIGGRLHQHADRHGHEITLVARGTHLAAMQRHGLTIHDPTGADTLDVWAVGSIADVPLTNGDVVVLAMKTQHTAAALDDLAAHAPAGITVVCAQNGVENERLALRRFTDVIGVCVMLPATFLEPGVVDAHGAPHNAIVDLGRIPSGVDDTCVALSAALEASGLASRPTADVLRWKYAKLLNNLANSADALLDDRDAVGEMWARARAEALACFAAAGIDAATEDEDRARRDGVMTFTEIEGRPRGGGSTWQSFARGSDSSEVEWLNGEISLLGRLHGIDTPVNTALQRAATVATQRRLPPRSMTSAQVEALVRTVGVAR